MPDLLLVADVGGTNTRLRLVEAAAPAEALEEHVYGEGRAVDGAVTAFLERIGDRRSVVRAACFGVAGRVVDGDVRMTNRPSEVITDERIAATLGLAKQRVRVVNDMEAHMSGVDASQTVPLRAGIPIGSVEGIVMPGTGLGIGYAVRAGQRRLAFASEGGHLDFGPPRSALDVLLQRGRAHRQAVEAGAERISWEWFVSGPGLARIYAILEEHATGQARPYTLIDPKDVTAAASGGRGGGLDSRLAKLTTQTFLELVGARAGNLALDTLATRGMFLGGNILNGLYDEDPPAFIAALASQFDAVGPAALRETMTAVPLTLVRSSDSGLRGAAVLARELI